MEHIINEAILQGISNNVKNYDENNKDINMYVAMCYVPMQEWEEIYEGDVGFCAGTIFPCLNKPFHGGGK